MPSRARVRDCEGKFSSTLLGTPENTAGAGFVLKLFWHKVGQKSHRRRSSSPARTHQLWAASSLQPRQLIFVAVTRWARLRRAVVWLRQRARRCMEQSELRQRRGSFQQGKLGPASLRRCDFREGFSVWPSRRKTFDSEHTLPTS